MLCFGELKRQRKMLSVFCNTISLVCEGHLISCLLALNKLYNRVKLVASSHSILTTIFGSSLNCADSS